MNVKSFPHAVVSGTERRFYGVTRAFGRFGMRIFTPKVMDAAHWHGHVEANFVSGATMTYEFDGQTIEVPEERLTIFWAAIPHQLTKVTPTRNERPRLANIYLPVDSFLFMPHLAELQAALMSGGMAALSTDLIDLNRLRLWYTDYRSNDTERLETLKMDLNALLRRAQFSAFDFLRPPQGRVGAEHGIGSTSIRHVIEMVRFILDNSTRSLSNTEVAAVTGLHPNYAMNIFSQIMRMPMKQFVIRMRLLRARAMLAESALPISVIASDSGFSSISQFYEHFRKAYGVAPNAMRESRISSVPL